MRLIDLKEGQSSIITKVTNVRIMTLGVVEGTHIECIVQGKIYKLEKSCEIYLQPGLVQAVSV